MGRHERSTARSSRLAAWEARVVDLLTRVAAAVPDSDAAGALSELAGAVVGMFNAGARDAEVAAFLASAAPRVPGFGALSVERLNTLATELHLAAVTSSDASAT